jgi:hypothetical protein
MPPPLPLTIPACVAIRISSFARRPQRQHGRDRRDHTDEQHPNDDFAHEKKDGLSSRIIPYP